MESETSSRDDISFELESVVVMRVPLAGFRNSGFDALPSVGLEGRFRTGSGLFSDEVFFLISRGL